MTDDPPGRSDRAPPRLSRRATLVRRARAAEPGCPERGAQPGAVGQRRRIPTGCGSHRRRWTETATSCSSGSGRSVNACRLPARTRGGGARFARTPRSSTTPSWTSSWPGCCSEVASDGPRRPRLARPVNAEQSNTSLVFDDRLILKVFRRLHAGPIPTWRSRPPWPAAGFQHVADPLVIWHEGPLRPGLRAAVPGGRVGGVGAGAHFAPGLLQLGVRATPRRPEETSRRRPAGSGRMTAEMHLALAEAFGADAGSGARARATWDTLVDRIAGSPEGGQ